MSKIILFSFFLNITTIIWRKILYLEEKFRTINIFQFFVIIFLNKIILYFELWIELFRNIKSFLFKNTSIFYKKYCSWKNNRKCQESWVRSPDKNIKIAYYSNVLSQDSLFCQVLCQDVWVKCYFEIFSGLLVFCQDVWVCGLLDYKIIPSFASDPRNNKASAFSVWLTLNFSVAFW